MANLLLTRKVLRGLEGLIDHRKTGVFHGYRPTNNHRDVTSNILSDMKAAREWIKATVKREIR